MLMAKTGLYENIRNKRKRIAAGSKETMRKPGTKGAPTAANFAAAAKTAKPQRAAKGGVIKKMSHGGAVKKKRGRL
jgi:hypothetical protein